MGVIKRALRTKMSGWPKGWCDTLKIKPLVPRELATSAHSFPGLQAWPKTWIETNKNLSFVRNIKSLTLLAQFVFLVT